MKFLVSAQTFFFGSRFFRSFLFFFFIFVFLYVSFCTYLYADVFADNVPPTPGSTKKKPEESTVSTLVRFGDYILGHPRTTKDFLELCGMGLTVFCGIMAVVTYLTEHGYFHLFFLSFWLRIF